MVVTIISFISLLLCFVLAAGLIKIREMEQENRLMQSYLLSMEAFYSGIQSKIEATRKYRHDLAKHIQTLESLLERQSEMNEMKDYMECLKQRYDSLKRQEFCSNELVNSILNIKKEQCEEKRIPLTINVDDCIYSGIEEMDIVGLLYNLLDNAIEAQERIPDREEKGIWFSMSQDEKNVLLEIKNKIAEGEKVTFTTKKLRQEEHGIGTKIIENLAEKYHGTIENLTDEATWMFEEKIVLHVED